MSGNPFWKELAVLNNSGKLDSTFRRLFFARPRPMFELFDLERDPFELNNLYGDDQVAGPQQQLLEALNRWMIRYQDFVPLPIDIFRKKCIWWHSPVLAYSTGGRLFTRSDEVRVGTECGRLCRFRG